MTKLTFEEFCNLYHEQGPRGAAGPLRPRLEQHSQAFGIVAYALVRVGVAGKDAPTGAGVKPTHLTIFAIGPQNTVKTVEQFCNGITARSGVGYISVADIPKENQTYDH